MISSRHNLMLRVYYFASFAAIGAYAPFFPRWLVARGIEGVAMGAILAAIPAMGLLGPPTVGLIADRLGLRGSLLRFASFGSFLVFAFLTTAGALGLPLAFLEIFAAALVHAAFRSPMTLMADIIAIERADETGTSYGRIRLWGSLGSLAASVGVGRLLDVEHLTALPAAIAAFLLVASLAVWGLPARSARPHLPGVRQTDLLRSVDFPVFLGAAFFAQIALASYDVCFSLHLTDLGASDALIGAAWAVALFAEVALMTFASSIITYFTPARLVTLALFGVAIRCALLASLQSIPALIATQALHALSVGLWWLSALAYIKDRAPPQAIGTATGLYNGAAAAGGILGMLGWGGLFARAGGRVTFGAATIVALCAGGLALVWLRRAQAVLAALASDEESATPLGRS